MNSLNIFNEESNEPIDLMDSLHVMLSSDHKELDGTKIKKHNLMVRHTAKNN